MCNVARQIMNLAAEYIVLNSAISRPADLYESGYLEVGFSDTMLIISVSRYYFLLALTCNITSLLTSPFNSK
jgi:hypothetical protein